MLKEIILIFYSFMVVFGHPPKCYLPQAKGTSSNCSYEASIRYHFDPKTNICHAFKYEGCGGNVNNYETPGDCGQNCNVDEKTYIQCALGAPPIFDSRGNNNCPLTSEETGEGCESDEAVCKYFSTMALCCNKTVEVGLKEDQSTTCPSGKSRWQIGGITVLAKTCDDVICPNGYTCQNGMFFSYCCEN